MKKFLLSAEADSDLEDIYYFGILNFGLRRADAYIDAIYERFHLLERFPEMGPARPDIAKDIRIHLCERHMIIYTIEAECVFILRVLGSEMDVMQYFRVL